MPKNIRIAERQASPLEWFDEAEVGDKEADFPVEGRNHIVDEPGMLRDVALQSAEFVREEASDEFEDALFDVIKRKVVFWPFWRGRFDNRLPEPSEPLQDRDSIVRLGREMRMH